MRPVVSSSGKRGPDALLGGDELGQHELALAAHETVDMHDRRARRRRVVAWPLDRAELVEPSVGYALEGRRRRGDLVHDLARMGVAHRRRRCALASAIVASQSAIPASGANRLAHAVDAALGVGERAVLLQERRAGQEHMRVARGLVEEEILHDDAFHRPQARGDVLRVGVGLGDVFALDVEPLERAVDRLVDHVGNAQARLVAERHAPQRLEHLARRVVGDVAVAGELVRERAHVARALHVVLAAQRIHADAVAADVAGRHREIGDRHHRGRALAVFGDAKAVIDRAVAAGGIEPRGGAQFARGRRRSPPRSPRANAARRRRSAPRISKLARSQRSRDESLVDEALGDNDMRERVERPRHWFRAAARDDSRP